MASSIPCRKSGPLSLRYSRSFSRPCSSNDSFVTFIPTHPKVTAPDLQHNAGELGEENPECGCGGRGRRERLSRKTVTHTRALQQGDQINIVTAVSLRVACSLTTFKLKTRGTKGIRLSISRSLSLHVSNSQLAGAKLRQRKGEQSVRFAMFSICPTPVFFIV